MEFIVINSDKLKVILSEEEMVEYDIHPDKFDYSDNVSKNVLRSVLDKALSEAGFDSRKTKLFVQMFSSKAGGCEIFISKIERQNCSTYETDYNISRKHLICYIFLDFKTMCNLCLRIKETERNYKTSLYSDNETKYCLLFTKNDHIPSYLSCECDDQFYPPYLCEYGNAVESEIKFLDYLNEHYNCIISEDAVEKIASFLS